jgi:hypothetical protein
MASKTDLKAGDRVSWGHSQGRSTGKVVRKLTKNAKIKSFEVKASKDDPKFEVESEKTGAHAAHRAGELRKLGGRKKA